MADFESKLFHLIRSLSGSERRYFKIFASRHVIGESNLYVRLFDLIDVQPAYDEEALIKSEKRLKRSSLHTLKSYLYDLILRSLDDFHSNRSLDTKLRKELSSIEILAKRSLYKQSHSLIKKNKIIANANEKFALLIEILELEFYLFDIDPQWNSISRNENHKRIIEEKKEAMSKIVLTDESKLLYSQSMRAALLQDNETTSDEEKAKLKEAIRLHGVKLKKHTQLGYANLYHLYAGGGFFSYCRKFSIAGENYKKAALLLENNTMLIKATPGGYFISAGNYLNMLLELKQYVEIFSQLKRIRSAILKYKFLSATPRLRSLYFSVVYNAELSALVSIGEVNKAIRLIPEIERGMAEYGSFISNPLKLCIWINVSFASLIAGDYKNALKWINLVLNAGKTEEAEEINASARIVNLIIHYELGNADALEYIIKSNSRYLQNKKRLFKFEQIVLDFFQRKIPAVNSREEFVNALSDLKEKMLRLKKNKEESAIFYGFDYVAWIDSKLKNKSMESIIRSNFAKKK